MIRVGIVEDQMLVRQGLHSMLSLADDIEVVAEAENGEEALRIFPAHCLDVLLLDYRMPKLDGLGVLRALSAAGTLPPTLILTTFDDDDLVLAGVQAGARGYLLKDVPLSELLEAVRTLASGGRWLRPGLSRRVRQALEGALGPSSAQGSPVHLTEREREVLRLIARGFNNREIGTLLSTTEGTIKSYASNIFSKLGVRDRTRAVLRAADLGLL